MNKDEIKKGLTVCAGDSCDNCSYYKFHNCYDRLKLDARSLIIEQEKKIEKLKAENEELTKVVSSKVYDLIDNAKEIADAREAWERQAKIDVLNELKDGYGLYYLSVLGVKERMLAYILNPMIEELKK